MHKNSLVRGACAIAVALSVQSMPVAFAQDSDVAAFYKGKQITLFIASAVGGGYDTYGRLVGRYLSAYIPGNPTIVPVNMVGAGGALAVTHIQTVAPKDGTSIAALQPGSITAPLYADKQIYDSRSLVYLGSANSEDDGCWVRSDAEVKSYQEVFSKEVIIGSSARGDTTYDLPNAQNNILGTKFKLVPGYSGNNEILLAMDKNEVQGICGTGVPSMMAQKPDWVAKGFVKMLVQENAEGSPKLNQQGVPRSPDFAKTDEDRKALDLVYISQKFGRPFAMAAGAPPERVAALRHAFMQVLQDKQLLAEAEKLHLDIQPMSGEDLQKLVADTFKTPDAIVARAKKALTYGGSN